MLQTPSCSPAQPSKAEQLRTGVSQGWTDPDTAGTHVCERYHVLSQPRVASEVLKKQTPQQEKQTQPWDSSSQDFPMAFATPPISIDTEMQPEAKQTKGPFWPKVQS